MAALKPKLLLWGNPAAGAGQAKNLISALTKALSDNFEVGNYLCPNLEDLDRWWKSAELRWSRVLVVGGDGTFAKVASHFLGRNIPVNLYPAGAGNDICHLSKFPTHPKSFAAEYLRAREIKLDVGAADGHYFFNSFGVGFDAQVAAVSEKFKSWPGKLRYVCALLSQTKHFTPFDLELKFESLSRTVKATSLSIGNGARVGGGFFLTPDAVPDDGILDLCLVEAVSRKQILWNFPKLFKGKHTRLEFTKIYRAKNIAIKAPAGTPLHIDGDPVQMNFPITISLAPQKLPFLVRQ
ncbi:MAG TPA: diacylglycerol kinase family protein [candidate division Zixibacteria bacterium]|nr:diacylglycerol kinase family protein [candidate division Zixibacteria bacterium]